MKPDIVEYEGTWIFSEAYWRKQKKKKMLNRKRKLKRFCESIKNFISKLEGK